MSNFDAIGIDFLPVGQGDHSGDAIVVQYGSNGRYELMVIDGGDKASGQEIVDHIQEVYGTNEVQHVVNTHPDRDYASGLYPVIDQLDVKNLWMHQPWNHSTLIRDYFHDGRMTDNSLAERLRQKMSAAHDLEKLAIERSIPIIEPFQGMRIGPFFVLSPEKEWYIHTLISKFEKSPQEKITLSDSSGALRRFIQKAITWISENWYSETLREDVTTSAENESSVVMWSGIGGGVLVTGDAGIQGLTAAYSYFESLNILLPDVVQMAQIPHHGSRNNVSPTVLDNLIGKCVPSGTSSKEAIVSASSGSEKHPRKAVVNAFLRRGMAVTATQGKTIYWSRNMPARPGWGPAARLGFSEKVEDWD